MKKDIKNRDDIEKLVNIFYRKILADDLVDNIYREMPNLKWEPHLAAIYNFWENIILFTGNYEGSPINLLKQMHHARLLNRCDFDRWKQLFISTVDELFAGEKADLIKMRASGISGILKEKIFEYPQADKNIY